MLYRTQRHALEPLAAKIRQNREPIAYQFKVGNQAGLRFRQRQGPHPTI